MKSFSFVLLGLLLLANAPFTDDLSSFNLEDAIKKGMVKCSAIGTGSYSGESIVATMKNQSGKKLFLKVPAGMVFQPADTGMQDLLIVKEELLVMEPASTRKVDLQGYCCKSNNRAPSPGISFQPVALKNTQLKQIAEFINQGKYNPDAIQSAVWSISDKHSVADVYDPDLSRVKPLRDEVCKLTGEKDVWYANAVEHHVNENGYIESAPVEVNGAITITVSKPSKIQQTVYKANGEVAWETKSELNLPRAGTISFKFHLQVKGWEKGSYYVLVHSGEKTLLKQEFSI